MVSGLGYIAKGDRVRVSSIEMIRIVVESIGADGAPGDGAGSGDADADGGDPDASGGAGGPDDQGES